MHMSYTCPYKNKHEYSQGVNAGIVNKENYNINQNQQAHQNIKHKIWQLEALSVPIAEKCNILLAQNDHFLTVL